MTSRKARYILLPNLRLVSFIAQRAILRYGIELQYKGSLHDKST